MKFSDILFMVFVGPLAPSMFAAAKIKEEPPQPLEVPTTEIGTIIPILWGTREITNPAIVYYGDVNIIKVKVDSGGKK